MFARLINPDGQQALVPFTVDGAEDPHAYFKGLRARPDHLRSWTLRTQAELDGLVKGATASTAFTYDAEYDAARFLLPVGAPNSASGSQQLWFPVGVGDGSVVITWDWRWGHEFQTYRGGVNFYKTWQVMGGGKGWWTIYTMMAWAMQAGEVGRAANAFRAGVLADGTLTQDTWTPCGAGTLPGKKADNSYPVLHSLWSRYWIEVLPLQPPSAFHEWADAHNGGVEIGPNPMDPEGRWQMVSIYLADAQRPVQRLMYRVPVNYTGTATWSPVIESFRFEMNTSQSDAVRTGPFVAHARNLAMLRNVTDLTPLLVQTSLGA